MKLTVLGSQGTWPGAGGATLRLPGERTRVHTCGSTPAPARSRGCRSTSRVDDIGGDRRSPTATPTTSSTCIPAFYARHYGGLGAPGLPVLLARRVHRAGGAARVRGRPQRDGGGLRLPHRRTAGDVFEIGPFRVTPYEMTHIGVHALGYRIEADGTVLAYTGDTGPVRRGRSSWRATPTCSCARPPTRTTRSCAFFHHERAPGGGARAGGGVDAVGAHAHLADARPRGVPRTRPPRRSTARSTSPVGRDDGLIEVGRVTPPGRARARRPLPAGRPWRARVPGVGRGLGAVLDGQDAGAVRGLGLGGRARAGCEAPGRAGSRASTRCCPRRPRRALAPRGEQGPARRAHAGDPAADRPVAAQRHRPARLGERTITIDCDVLQADAGTRTASITGGYVALALALRGLEAEARCPTTCSRDTSRPSASGIVDGEARLDLCYEEDAGAEVDFNVVMTGAGDARRGAGNRRGRAVLARRPRRDCSTWPRPGIAELTEIQQRALAG